MPCDICGGSRGYRWVGVVYLMNWIRINDSAKAVKIEKIETTYRYVPLIGHILGFWRTEKEGKIGEEIRIEINGEFRSGYDRVYINGHEI